MLYNSPTNSDCHIGKDELQTPGVGDYCSRDDKTPLVTVIVTTFGDSSTLVRAVDSALEQSYRNIEVVVVDDNGDGTPSRASAERLMKRYAADDRVVYLKHATNRNGSAARNTGIERARGDYITFLDDDDVLLRRRIENAVKTLGPSDAGAYFCDVLLLADGRYAGVKSREGLTWKDVLLSTDCFGTGSNLFFRRSVVEEVGMFDVSFRRNQDIEYVLRVLLEHEAVWGNTLDIVKSENATNNEQKFEAYLKTKEHFDEVFFDVIGRLRPEEEMKRQVNRAGELLFFAQKDGNSAACKRYLKRLRELGCPAGILSELSALVRCAAGGTTSGIEAAARYVRHCKVKRTVNPHLKEELAKWFT